jgi:hypothetical protein
LWNVKAISLSFRIADELTKQRDALIDEIQNVKQKEESERENMRLVHEEALKLQETELKSNHDEELQRGEKPFVLVYHYITVYC